MTGINYLYHCATCDVNEERQVPYKERDEADCEHCNCRMTRLITAPHSTRASYVDGQRGKSAEWKDLKEASKLNKAAAGEGDKSRRKEIQKEIQKTGYNLGK